MVLCPVDIFLIFYTFFVLIRVVRKNIVLPAELGNTTNDLRHIPMSYATPPISYAPSH
jgi:hypothetical protein